MTDIKVKVPDEEEESPCFDHQKVSVITESQIIRISHENTEMIPKQAVLLSARIDKKEQQSLSSQRSEKSAKKV